MSGEEAKPRKGPAGESAPRRQVRQAACSAGLSAAGAVRVLVPATGKVTCPAPDSSMGFGEDLAP